MSKFHFLSFRWLYLITVMLLAACSTVTSTLVPTPTLVPTSTALPMEAPSQTPIPSVTLRSLLKPTVTLPPTPIATLAPTPYTGLLPLDASLRLSKGPLRFVDLSPDGKTLLVGSKITLCTYQVPGGLENWCRTTGSINNGLLNALRGLAFSPDGKTFLVGTEDGHLTLWDSIQGQQLWSIPNVKLNTLAWSPDGTRIVISSQDLFLRILDSRDGSLLGKINLSSIPPLVLRWSPDPCTAPNAVRGKCGKMIAGGDASGQVTLWDATSYQALGTYSLFPTGHLVTSLAWSNDSAQILAGSSYKSCNGDCTPTNDGMLVLFDANSGHVTWQVDAKEAVQSVSLSPDGKIVLTRVGNKNLNLYQMRDGKKSQSIPVPGGMGTFWLPDGKSFVLLDGENNLVSSDLSGKQQTLTHLEGYYDLVAMVWSPDGTQLAVSVAGGPILIWDVSSSKVLKTFGEGASDGPLAWSPYGKQIVTVNGQNVIVWDTQTGDQIQTLQNPGKLGGNLGWSPDGRFLAALSNTDTSSPGWPNWTNYITLWNTSDWSLNRTINYSLDEFRILYIAWSPDGKMLAGAGGGVKTWDAVTGILIHDDPLLFTRYTHLEWSPDGAHFVVSDGEVYNSSYPFTSFYTGRGVTSAAFSPDGRYLVTAEELMVLRNPSNGSVLKVLNGTANQPDQLAFSPDGKTMASLSKQDGTVILWKVP